MKFPASELVLNDKGNVYHLDLGPDDIADKIILVGDQGRVELVSSFFDSIDFTRQHREFVTNTGTYKGKKISVISTGIGTDNIDIVINELDALLNIDLESRTLKNDIKTVDFLRIGTCGLLQSDLEIHDYILSSHAYGLDNIARFYKIPFSDEERQIGDAITKHLQLPTEISPYIIRSSATLFDKLNSDKCKSGITITSSGFYGPQGRQLRLKTKTQNLNARISSLQLEKDRITNFEMESSALFSLARALGHNAGTICLGIANRPNMQFSKGYTKEMNGLIEYALDRI